MSNISFIYFDVGGVLIKDFSGNNKWVEMKRDLGVTPKTDAAFEAAWDIIDDRVCIDYDVDQLTDIICKIPGIIIPHNYSMLDDFVNRFEYVPSMWPLIERLHQKIPLGLLTNMYPRMLDKIFKKGLVKKKLFKVIIDSSVVGIKKPQNEIFTLAQKSAGVDASHILFIDNTLKNIKAARRVGWQTFHYSVSNPNGSIEKLATQLLPIN